MKAYICSGGLCYPLKGQMVFSGGLQITIDGFDVVYSGGQLYMIGARVVSSELTLSDAQLLYIAVNSNGSLSVASSILSNLLVKGGSLSLVDSTQVNSITIAGGTTFVSSGCTVSDIDAENGRIIVYSGGTALNVFENGGFVDFAPGAYSTMVPHVLSDYILDGPSRIMTLHPSTTASNIIVNTGSVICYGSMALTTLNNSGHVDVSSGGTANKVVVNGGLLQVFSGGTAIDVKENGGWVWLTLDAFISFVPNTFGGTVSEATVHPKTVASSATLVASITYYKSGELVSCGEMLVLSGGTALSTTIESGTTMRINYGGTANSITISSGGTLVVSSGGVASNITSAVGATITYRYY